MRPDFGLADDSVDIRNHFVRIGYFVYCATGC